MAIHEADHLELILGKTNHRQDIWIWLFLQNNQNAGLDPDSCNGRTMRDTLAQYIEIDKRRLIEIINKGMDQFMVPDEHLAWMSYNERQTRWLLPRVANLTGLRELGWLPRLRGKDLLLGAIDLWNVDLDKKVEELEILSSQWNRHIRNDHLLKWFEDKKEGELRCKYAWEWIQKEGKIFRRDQACFESHADLVMFLDDQNLREREIKDIAQSIRRSWNRKAYLEKLEDKKQYNFILSNKVIELLDSLAEAKSMKRPQMLEKIINEAYDEHTKNKRPN